VRGLPALVLSGEGGAFAYAANAGVVVRGAKQFAATSLGSEILFGGAAGVLLADRALSIGPEVYGTTTLENAFERNTTNVEAILGARGRVGNVVLGAGAGPGLSHGLGTPALRVVASVAWVPVPEEKAAPPPPEPTPTVAPSDRDGDGIIDLEDACPDVKGVANSDPKKNGCPPDRDGDGIFDPDDACPDVKGVASDDPKKNGCPSDRDGDGIIDDEDACPDVKGVASKDPKKNGCPPDRDGDGILDVDDACPDVKGVANEDPKKNGCPLVQVTDKSLMILQQVQFETASDVILPESDALLTDVASVLKDHPEIEKVEVQGHTDNKGAAAYNKNLSRRRAASVVKWLTTRGGIDAKRLTSNGYGMAKPIADNNTDEGRGKNRRVEFKILKSGDVEPGKK
jgi:outer membrane protein OmpA-like peptidoglycan-associated protein